MEECEPWQWMAFHAESSFFSVDASEPPGSWDNVVYYARDAAVLLCGLGFGWERPFARPIDGPGFGGGGGALLPTSATPPPCPAASLPDPEVCWPAAAMAAAFLAIGGAGGGSAAALNGTLNALDLTLRQSVDGWRRAVRGRWPVFGVLLRTLVRFAGGIDWRAECEPSGATIPGAHEAVHAVRPRARARLRSFVRATCPHFEELDRLVCPPWIGGSKGGIRVFPFREVISDRIRGTGSPSCGLGVDAEVERAQAEAAKRGEQPIIVEVGPFLCDCLWLHARDSRRWIAFELNEAAARLCAETIQANSFGPKARIVVAAVGDGRPVRKSTNRGEPSWTTSKFDSGGAGGGGGGDAGGEGGDQVEVWIPTIRLDDYLPTHFLRNPGDVIDLLILHTNGFEHAVLAGAEALLRAGHIRAVAGPVIGNEDWTRRLPSNFSVQGMLETGTGSFVKQQAVAAHWTGSV